VGVLGTCIPHPIACPVADMRQMAARYLETGIDWLPRAFLFGKVQRSR
jgi:hypothetical protein